MGKKKDYNNRLNSLDQLGSSVPKNVLRQEVVQKTQSSVFENIVFLDDKRKDNSVRFFNELKQQKRIEMFLQGEDIFLQSGNKRIPAWYFLKTLTNEFWDRTDHEEIEDKVKEICKENGITTSMKYLWSEVFDTYIEYGFIDSDKIYMVKRFFTILEESEKKEMMMSRKKEQGKERYRLTVEDEQTNEKITISVNTLFACLPKEIEGNKEKDAYLLCQQYHIGLKYDKSVFER